MALINFNEYKYNNSFTLKKIDPDRVEIFLPKEYFKNKENDDKNDQIIWATKINEMADFAINFIHDSCTNIFKELGIYDDIDEIFIIDYNLEEYIDPIRDGHNRYCSNLSSRIYNNNSIPYKSFSRYYPYFTFGTKVKLLHGFTEKTVTFIPIYIHSEDKIIGESNRLNIYKEAFINDHNPFSDLLRSHIPRFITFSYENIRIHDFIIKTKNKEYLRLSFTISDGDNKEIFTINKINYLHQFFCGINDFYKKNDNLVEITNEKTASQLTSEYSYYYNNYQIDLKPIFKNNQWLHKYSL